MPPVIDIAGEKYGRLRVVRRVKNMNGRVSWECVCDCGTVKICASKTLRNGGTKSCGCLHREQSAQNAKTCEKPIGHERKTSKGYVVIKTKKGFKRKHVFVMEQHLKRELLPGEVVHHIDEDLTNNHLENLLLMTHGEHTRLHHVGVKLSYKAKKLISEKAKKRTIENGHRGRKLNKLDVVKIKTMLGSGDYIYADIAEMFSVTKGNIAAISQGRIWKQIQIGD